MLMDEVRHAVEMLRRLGAPGPRTAADLRDQAAVAEDVVATLRRAAAVVRAGLGSDDATCADERVLMALVEDAARRVQLAPSTSPLAAVDLAVAAHLPLFTAPVAEKLHDPFVHKRLVCAVVARREAVPAPPPGSTGLHWLAPLFDVAVGMGWADKPAAGSEAAAVGTWTARLARQAARVGWEES